MFKKIITIMCLLALLLTCIPVDLLYIDAYAYESNVEAKFSISNVDGNRVKKIHIEVSKPNTSMKDFKIVLPNGYMVEGNSADYIADINGVYYFTVYESLSARKTFTYTVKDIGKSNVISNTSENAVTEESDFNLNVLFLGIELQYDYEEMQCLLHCDLDKVRNIKIGSSTYKSNIINHYISDIAPGTYADYIIQVEDKSLAIRIERQGDFYLMSIWQTISEESKMYYLSYRGYSFTTNSKITCTPQDHLLSGNDEGEIVVASDTSSKVFTYNIESFDTMRPKVELFFNSNYYFEFKVKDNKSLDYYIDYKGEYVDLYNLTDLKELEDTIEDRITYNGIYYFTFVDTAGNRSVEKIEVKDRVTPPYVGKLGPSIHNNKDSLKILRNTGNEYNASLLNQAHYKNIFPSYMNGKSKNSFGPKDTISRAEMVTILCRVNDLKYDITSVNKLRFTDIAGHWAQYYIGMGYKKRYIKGKTRDTFDPDGVLSKAEFCKMITNISAIKSKISAIPSVNNYKFADINTHWAKVDILKLANRDLVYGISSDTFSPDTPITREEVVYAINRIYGLNPSSYELAYMKKLFEKHYNFNDISTSPYYNDIVVSVMGMFREIER